MESSSQWKKHYLPKSGALPTKQPSRTEKLNLSESSVKDAQTLVSCEEKMSDFSGLSTDLNTNFLLIKRPWLIPAHKTHSDKYIVSYCQSHTTTYVGPDSWIGRAFAFDGRGTGLNQ